ncbi:MAG: hypothetical protein MJH10_17500, partial [Epibacterium sp.]|nr:hypothetical protein [Epibacterium sp.]NQX75303.1 hypothetical protein [Epibacterium sp.]
MTINKNCVVLEPFSITNDMLLNGPPDAENQVYAHGTPYDTGQQVWHNGRAWESRVDGNVSVYPVAGANWADLGEVDRGA